jgi:hypothetical protein
VHIDLDTCCYKKDDKQFESAAGVEREEYNQVSFNDGVNRYHQCGRKALHELHSYIPSEALEALFEWRPNTHRYLHLRADFDSAMLVD